MNDLDIRQRVITLEAQTHQAQASPFNPHQPFPKQKLFLEIEGDEALFGGQAGGSKTDALLQASLEYVDVPGYAGILFRRTITDLQLPGALLDRAHGWLRRSGAKWNGQTNTYTFPSNATLTFAYLQTEQDKYRYQSAEFQFVGWDELTQFCLTPEHEVLTDDGWKFISKVKAGERVLSYSSEKSIEWGTVSHTYSFEFTGQLVSVRHGRLSYDVTPNHKIVIEGQKNATWRLCRADKLPHFAYHPRKGNWIGGKPLNEYRFRAPTGRGCGRNVNAVEKVDGDTWVEFLGWWFAEGSTFLSAKSRGGTSPCVSIRQTKTSVELIGLMKRFPFTVKSDRDGGYRIFSRQLFDALRPLGNTYTKRIPTYIKNLCLRQLNIFFDAFAKGDGSFSRRSRAVMFELANEGLVDDLQEIAIKLGRPSAKGYYVARKKFPVWTLNVYGPELDRVEIREKHRSRISYSGNVHCLTVAPNHTFLVRHGGHLFWSGNSEDQYRYLFSRLRRPKMPCVACADPQMELAMVRSQNGDWKWIHAYEPEHAHEPLCDLVVSREYPTSLSRPMNVFQIPLRMRSASNPGGIGAEWVKNRFIPDDFRPEDAKLEKVWSKEVIDLEGDEESRTTTYFVPSRKEDNPFADVRGYTKMLNKLGRVARKQLGEGDWSITEVGRPYFTHVKIDQYQKKHPTTGELTETRNAHGELQLVFAVNDQGMLAVFNEPVPGRRYVIGSDTAKGRDRNRGQGKVHADWSVDQVVDLDSGEQVARFRGRVTEGHHGEIVYRLHRWYNLAYVVPATTGGYGTATLNRALELGVPVEFVYATRDFKNPAEPRVSSTADLGFIEGTTTRQLLYSGVEVAMMERGLEIYDAVTINELYSFEWNKDGNPEARVGCYDDCVTAVALAVIGIKFAPRNLWLKLEERKLPPQVIKYGLRPGENERQRIEREMQRRKRKA